jgi:hypothetical protein
MSDTESAAGPRRPDPPDPARTATRSIETNAEPAAVVSLLADARRIPEWAPAFADEVTGDAESGWRVTKDGRTFSLRVVVGADAGTVDYLRDIAPGREGGAYVRSTPRPGGGSVVVMTVPVIPDVNPTDISLTLRDELIALTRLLARHL